jgi:uncharacterized protein
MLGTLARWLRFAGFDTFYEPHVEDVRIATLARSEGRWLVTMDRRLAAAAGPRSLLLRGRGLESQVDELRRRVALEAVPARFLTRCSACNGALEEAERSEVVAQVPPFVAATAPRFLRCGVCGRVYWKGTHTARIAARLAALFKPR